MTTTESTSKFGRNLTLGIIALGVFFLAFFLVGTYVSYANKGVTFENGINTQYKANQNHLGQLSLKVKESLGVAKLNNAELDRIIRGSLEGRYGDGGAEQAMLWVKENYPGQYDPALMLNVQQTILAGRTDFQVKQDLLLDKVNVYRNETQYVWSGFWLGLTGHPPADWNWDTYNPVLAPDTAEKFDTKVDEGFEIK